MSSERIYLYPIWVRLWHFFNAVLCLLLIISGLCMQYACAEVRLIRFDIAVSMHNITGILLSVSYIVFVIGNWRTKNGKYYRAKVKGLFKKLNKQFMYYTIGIFKNAEKPFPVTKKRKFNPMQKVSYILVMYVLMPVIFITGWALLFPEMVIHNIWGFSGLHLTGMLHIVVGFFISIFMLIHIYFCTIGTTSISNYKAMINGWHE